MRDVQCKCVGSVTPVSLFACLHAPGKGLIWELCLADKSVSRTWAILGLSNVLPREDLPAPHAKVSYIIEQC